MSVLRVLIVDDSAVFRKMLMELLGEIPEIEIVGMAHNGKVALRKISEYKPDLVTLDHEMPVKDGLSTLVDINRHHSGLMTLMISAYTRAGVDITMKALELGAFDFIAKPDFEDGESSERYLRQELRRKINAAITRHKLARIIKKSADSSEKMVQPVAKEPIPAALRPEIVCIAISTGGPRALNAFLPLLPPHFCQPIVIVQHMPAMFTHAFAQNLNSSCHLHVVEAADGQPVQSGYVYIAPGGAQLKIVRNGNGQPLFKVTDDPPENHCKPSADYLFRSVAREYGPNALALVMTGMGSDGVAGIKFIHREGGQIFAQDEASSVVFGMPAEAIRTGLVSRVVALDQVAPALLAACDKPCEQKS